MQYSSVGKESACNAGDPGSIPGSGRSAGEGIGYSLQYSWVSLVAQLVKTLLAVWETWVQSLGCEGPLRRERLPNPIFWPVVHGDTKSQTQLSEFHFLSLLPKVKKNQWSQENKVIKWENEKFMTFLSCQISDLTFKVHYVDKCAITGWFWFSIPSS